MTVTHPMLGSVPATVKGLATGPQGSVTLQARLDGIFGGDSQLGFTLAEAAWLERELRKIREARERSAGQQAG